MRTSTNKPTVTKKWHIEVPTHTYVDSPSCVYKVIFGKKYFIWKGKRLLQSAEQLAESIERYIRLQKNDPGNWLYHVCNHIKKSRVQSAKIEVLNTEFEKSGYADKIDVYKLLRFEQDMLDQAEGDPDCLNNNEQAYTAQWMPEEEVNRFLRTWNKNRIKK